MGWECLKPGDYPITADVFFHVEAVPFQAFGYFVELRSNVGQRVIRIPQLVIEYRLAPGVVFGSFNNALTSAVFGNTNKGSGELSNGVNNITFPPDLHMTVGDKIYVGPQDNGTYGNLVFNNVVVVRNPP